MAGRDGETFLQWCSRGKISSVSNRIELIGPPKDHGRGTNRERKEVNGGGREERVGINMMKTHYICIWTILTKPLIVYN